MAPKLILCATFIFVFFIYRVEAKRNSNVTIALTIPFIWFSIASTRLFGVWLNIWGIRFPGGGSGDPTSGSLVDRIFFVSLIIAGLIILITRRFDWGKFFSQNKLLVTFIGFMLLSILWSDYMGVSFKRFVKMFGSVIMILVVLTEPNKMDAISALIRRVAYFHLPLSIVCIRYFRDIAVSFDYTGTSSAWLGLATSKNTLGQFVVTCALYFIWEKIYIPSERKIKSLSTLYILMCLYLLQGSDDQISMTALAVFFLGVFSLFAINHFRRRNPQKAKPFSFCMLSGVFALLALIITHSIVQFSEDSFMGSVITAMGRDITLTDRTVIWSDVYDVAANSPLLGVGFGGFWIGEIANIPFSLRMTWVLGQSHNGYIETYLHLGYVGVALLILLIIRGRSNILNSMESNYEMGTYQLTLLLVIVFVNITESTFLRADHNMWFTFLLIITAYPTQNRPNKDEPPGPHNIPTTRIPNAQRYS